MNQTSVEKSLEAIEARLTQIESKLKNSVQLREFKSNKTVSTRKLATKPMSGNWLGMIASVCFIIAAAFIMKLSIESGWLTHEKQLGLATLLGLALFTAGIVISSKDRIYASFLPAAGATILYLTCFAAYEYYLLITFQTVIVITSIVSGLSIWFYVRFKHDIYAIIAAVGAYTAPIISNLDSNAIFSLYYFIICSFTFATFAIWVQSRTLTVIAAYLAILATSFIGLNRQMDTLIAIILALNFFIFSVGTYFFTQWNHQKLTYKESWSFFPVLLIFYAMEFYFISRIEPKYAAWVSLAAAALLVGLYYSAKRRSPEKQLSSSTVLLTFVVIVFFHSIYLELMPLMIRPWLFVFIIIDYSLMHNKLPISKSSMIFIIPSIALSAILGIEYLNIISHLATWYSLSWAVVAWAAFFSIWFALIMHRKELAKKDEYGYSLLAAAHLLAIMCLYQSTIQYGSLAVSFSWLLYALIVLGFSYIRNDILMAKSVLIVLSFAAGKALLFDAQSTPTIIRTLSLIVTGIVLYASGYVIRTMTNWRSKPKKN